MKVTFLVLAHANWKHLARLCDRLAEHGQPAIVHIDKRSSAPRMEFPQGISAYSRYRCYWAGFSLVEATIDLLRRGVAETDSDYFMLLSGTDYPIRPIPELLDFLARKPEMNYINIWHPGPNPYMDVTERYGHYFLEFDRRRRTPIYRQLHRVARILQKRERRIPIEITTGNQWFTLPRSSVEKLLNASANNDIYARTFRNTYCADEAFFQTALMLEKVVDPAKNLEPALVYTDWSGPDKPAWIQDSHVSLFRTTRIHQTHYGPQEFFFARKFNDASSEVADRIDRQLLTGGDDR